MAKLRVVAYTRGDTPLDDVEARFPEIEFRQCTRPEEGGLALPEADALFIARRITADEGRLIPATLRWLHISGAGVDHILPYLPPGVRPVVTNARGLSADLIAEYVMCAALVLRWQIPRALRAQSEKRWERWSTVMLAGQTLGVLGLGTIGKAVARRGRGIGMRVVGIRRQTGPVEEVDRVYPLAGLHTMLAEADVVAVTVPLTPVTENVIDAQAIGVMKRDAILVVVSRGRVVSEDALSDALRNGRLGAAALDVFANEPLEPSSPLWDVPNLLVTSHISGERLDIRELNAEFFKENLSRFLRGAPLRSVVDREAGY